MPEISVTADIYVSSKFTTELSPVSFEKSGSGSVRQGCKNQISSSDLYWKFGFLKMFFMKTKQFVFLCLYHASSILHWTKKKTKPRKIVSLFRAFQDSNISEWIMLSCLLQK